MMPTRMRRMMSSGDSRGKSKKRAGGLGCNGLTGGRVEGVSEQAFA